MSHTVRVKVEMRNPTTLREAAKALGLDVKERGRHELWGRNNADGLAISLPGWRYPIVINTDTGEAVYDNFGGSWGKQVELDKLVQRYAVEAAREQALLSGFQFAEQTLENGDIQVEMEQVAAT